MSISTGKSVRSKLYLHIDFVPDSRFLVEADELYPVDNIVERQWQHLSFLSTPVTSIVRFERIGSGIVGFVESRTTNNFINMIYFLCGMIKFDYPLYFT